MLMFWRIYTTTSAVPYLAPTKGEMDCRSRQAMRQSPLLYPDSRKPTLKLLGQKPFPVVAPRGGFRSTPVSTGVRLAATAGVT